MEEENPTKENNQTPSPYVDNISHNEELVRETLRKEREDIIREKMKSDSFKAIAHRTLERQDEELKSASNNLIKLDVETEQLRQVSENEMSNKVIIANDLENMKRITIMCEEQLSVFKKTLEDLEVKTINTKESKANISQQVQSFLENQKIRNETLEKEIRVMEAVIEVQKINYNKTLEEKTLELSKLNEESSKLAEEDEQLQKSIEEKENVNMLQQNKLEVARLQKHSIESEVEKLYKKISETKKEFEDEYLIQEEEIKVFEFKISLMSEKEEKQQKLLEELREKHKQLDEQITETKTEIEVLDSRETELRNIVTDKQKILEEKTTKISSLREENTLKKEHCKNTQIKLKEKLEQMEKRNDDIVKRVEYEKNKIQASSIALKDAEQNKELEENRLLDLQQKLEENSLNHNNQVKEYEQKIKEVQHRRTEKNNDNKRLSNLIEKLQKRMAEDKENFQAVINEKTAILEKLKLTLNNTKEELESEEKRLLILNSDLEKAKEIAERGPKLPKKKRDDLKKLEKQIKNYDDEMNIIKEKDNQNHRKQMKLLEESVKENLNKINDLKNLKDNLQEQLGQVMREIVDVAQKLEMKNKEKEVQAFKSPILPKRSKPIFITSTPRGVLKKPVENKPQIEETAEISPSDGEDEFKKIFPLTQRPNEQKYKTPMKVNSWPTDNETTDDSSVNKNISATQKPVQVTDLGKPEIFSTQSKKLPSLWPTDTEESEDHLRKKNIPPTQKLEKKGFEEDVDLFEDEETYKKVELEKVDPYQSKKKIPSLTQKSDKKCGLTQKSSVYIKEENDPFESLKTSTQIAAKKSETEKFDPSKPIKRMAIDFFATDNDESDDNFFGKLNKSKKIQEKLKPASREESVIDLLDTSSTD